MYKVVIPCAGTGSRVGQYSKHYNKTLITVADRPVISRIMDKIPEDIEVVIILGYKGDHIRQFIHLVYPNRRVTFVEVDKYEGPGSGIGYSLLCAQDELQCPFVFITNDTIVHDKSNQFTFNIDPTKEGNWIGYVDANDYNDLHFDIAQYRTLDISDDGFVTSVNPKGANSNNIYIGTCGVKDHQDFWNNMTFAAESGSIEAGEAFGINGLRQTRAIFFEKSWHDTGNMGALEHLKKHVLKTKYNILEKENEAIWFFENKVVKFSTDERFISDRVERLLEFSKSSAAELFPQYVASSKNFYIYKKEDAAVISDQLNIGLFRSLFEEMNDSLWSNRAEIGTLDCTNFYKTKMYDRVDDFFRRYEFNDLPQLINGQYCKRVIDVFNTTVDWEFICKTEVIPAAYHGDFHNENILLNNNGEFRLIDWRQNFSGDVLSPHIGDIYYDFAKFLHGLLIPYSSIMDGHFSITKDRFHSVNLSILRPYTFSEVEDELYKWLDSRGFSVEKTKILAALIFINIAALHEQPQANLFFYFGKYLLNKWTYYGEE